MSRRGCKRVRFCPDPEEEATQKPIFPTQQNRRRIFIVVGNGILTFGLKNSPAAIKLLKRIGAKVSKTLRFISLRKNTYNDKTTAFSRKVSSSSLSSASSSSSSSCSSSIYMIRSNSVAESESHRAEAIEDCIQFLNSSFSSFSTSNSLSS